MQRTPFSASFYLNAFGTQCDTLQIRENIMHAYYEIETEIPNNHQLNLSLPIDIPVGKAKIAIIYELPLKPDNKNAKMAQFLNNLPDKPHSGLTREQINQYLQHERETWGE
jgi:hypothetical protein